MTHKLKGTARIAAATCAALLLSGAVVTLSATVIGGQLVSMQRADTALASAAPELSVNRAGKGDKLPVIGDSVARAQIKSVEVIGLTNASIVYRDRDGNVLYRTDPLANVTVVSKNVELPEVTIRESDGVRVERIPVEEAAPNARPHGCESAFARPAPESLTRLSNRCVTDATSAVHRLAAQTALP